MLQVDPVAAASAEAGEHLLPWMGDVSNAMDRFDARLLLEEMPQPGQPPRSAAARATWEAAAAITEGAPVDAEALDRERYRGLADSSDSEGSSSEGASQAPPIPRICGLSRGASSSASCC